MEKSRILIVEDERIVAEDLRATLEHEGYAVVGIEGSGERAVARATATKPDLVLMDIHLDGEMDGITAAETIRSREGTPVVFLTAFSNDQTLSRARETDAFGFIVKPFQEKAVVAAIEMALGKHRKERARFQREEMLQSGLMNLPLGVIMTDEQDRIVFANAPARRHIGRSLEQGHEVRLSSVFARACRAPGDPGIAPDEERGAIVGMTGTRLEVAYSEETLSNEGGHEIGRIIIYQDADHPPIPGELGRLLRSFMKTAQESENDPAKYVTICAWSKRIRVGDRQWVSFEEFLTHYVGLNVTHGMAPEVAAQWVSSGFREPERRHA